MSETSVFFLNVQRATTSVNISAAGTASQIPFNSKNLGRTVRNRSSRAKERRKVIIPEIYPLLYVIIRIAAKILIPENKNPNPYKRSPETAMSKTVLPGDAKKHTPIGANR